MTEAVAKKLLLLSAEQLRKPLALAEFPFRHLPIAGFNAFLESLARFPELSGPLSRAARDSLGLTPSQPANFTIIEVHADLSDIDDELAIQLMTLGFEPDDFFELHPKCYKRHFTLKLEIERSNIARRKCLLKYAKSAYDSAAKSVQNHQAIFGYIELEAYASINMTKPISSVANSIGQLDEVEFFLSKYNLRPLNVANRKLQRGADELDALTTKNADLHIKIPRILKLSDQNGYLSAKRIFLACGFYEIIGESGNSIFTCQFLDAALAKRIFDEISSVISKLSAPLHLTWEPCLQFWRKQVVTGDDSLFSPVPGIDIQRSEAFMV
jgi:hypothetical protein